MKVYERTENGTVTQVSAKDGMAEINHAMMEGKREVREMFYGPKSGAIIRYKDGRHVRLVPTTVPEPAAADTGEKDNQGRRIVTVKDKRYIVGTVVPARPRTPGAKSWIPRAYVSYWSERNGETFGPTRTANGDAKPGTVGRAIWDAVNAG
ncbi:hypothetical protein [Streptomyces sioyaensis]|uniref:hypothetical protein n=1 Tax=Streptomyces sioyaensis TaxID=67364 RepID=UPI0037B9895B